MKVKKTRDKTMFSLGGEIECWSCLRFNKCEEKKEGYAPQCPHFFREERVGVVEENRQKWKSEKKFKITCNL
jgi:hypothetical protein